ncbi:MAG: hypothetical protein FJ293_03305 [Planctomycetes bacterium]|nr:hypothetical protein [Planctomycetota bacterium]
MPLVRSIALAALSLIVALPPPVPAAARRPAPAAFDTPSRIYRDPVHKFSFKMYPKWGQVPVEITEKYEVAKFFESGDRGSYFDPEVNVYRIDKKSGAGGPVTGLDPSKLDNDKLRELLEQSQAPKSTFDLAFGNLIVPEGAKNADPTKFTKITSFDKVDGKLWIHEIQRGTNPKVKTTMLLVMLAAFEKDGIEYGLRFSGPSNRRKEFEPAMKTMAKSFVFHDDKAKEVVNLDEILAGLNITPKRRGDIEKGLVKGWGVEVSPKKNYVIIYNTKSNKNLRLANTIAERIESIREQIYEVQFKPAEPIKAVSIVRICGDRNEYHKYGGPPGSAGYWNSWAEELVFYDASPAKEADDDTLAVLYHEAFHQYIYYSVGNVAPHSWFNEGHGDYYAGSRYKSHKWKVGPFDWRVGTVKNAIREGPRTFTVKKDEQSGKEVKLFASDKGYTPIKDLVAFSQGDYYSYPGVSYAQGWSLIYFLREEVPKNKKYAEKWGKILDTYFNALKREVNKEGRLRRGGFGDPEKPDRPDDGPAEPEDPDAPADPTDPTDPGSPDDPDAGGDEPPADPGFQPLQQGEASESSLEIALREAFTGVDFDEFETAWKEFTLKVSG